MKYNRATRLERLPIAERDYYREVECRECDGFGYSIRPCVDRDPETGDCTECYEHNCEGPTGHDGGIEFCGRCDGGRSCVPVSPLERLAECADGYRETAGESR